MTISSNDSPPLDVVANDSSERPLTDEQTLAAGTRSTRVVIEAAPGSGKTTVAAQRFGCLRYRVQVTHDDLRDHRAVVAVSFTKSATRELRARTESTWGPSALRWPHRITTIDTLVHEIVSDLLSGAWITWPGGHVALTVHDSWKGRLPHTYGYKTWVATYVNGGIELARRATARQLVPSGTDVDAELEAGHCTHDDLRSVLDAALKEPDICSRVRRWLGATIRCLIVDEVYDANELDLRLVEIAAESGCEITLIGDPWQALYGFRGASPDEVPQLCKKLSMETLYLSKSFRFRSNEQKELAQKLRSGAEVELPPGRPGTDCEIVIARMWSRLWDTGYTEIIPLAWGAARDDKFDGLATILLDIAARQLTGKGAVFKSEALQALGITEVDAETMRLCLTEALQGLAGASDAGDLAEVYCFLDQQFRRYNSGRGLPPEPDTELLQRMWALGRRLRAGATCVPGITAHQAKGQEWHRVGVRLDENERYSLKRGLRSNNESHRILYVACTRARWKTVQIA
ncbi:DNA helicase-2/ATP-dependent DNA helicase PcrA [Nocardia kruczakiae]|uniref:DNA helicase-2/ATP-dependent DNA helicase PcrA n=1 Tax=Nocardia kruczakiae TaxID=261477 RepID=A0ABU1XR01_9NOCA|nr:UvrD-helicase domain-containing protein [Nocardia kruczakiae]MDR7172951.1 DNA helicase-2/ATP-dependent DNA helicase PcrA [Nocardia kruczakiae]